MKSQSRIILVRAPLICEIIDNEVLPVAWRNLSNIVNPTLPWEKTQIMVKIRGFEPRLTKKNAKIDYNLTKKGLKPSNLYFLNGAAGGNRTRVTTLEGWSSTTELQPRNSLADQTRIELAISSVTGRHVNRYTTDPQQRYFAIT